MAVIAAHVAHRPRIAADGDTVLRGQLEREQFALNLDGLLLLFFELDVAFPGLLGAGDQVAGLLDQLGVGPGLLDEVRGSALQSLDREFNRAPSRNDQNGNRCVGLANARDQVQALGSDDSRLAGDGL